MCSWNVTGGRQCTLPAVVAIAALLAVLCAASPSPTAVASSSQMLLVPLVAAERAAVSHVHGECHEVRACMHMLLQ